MIQFNLLPDVKVQYIKTKRMKRYMILGAFAAAGVSALLLFLTASFVTVQNRHLGNLDADIKKAVNELNNTPDLTRIISVQNQLKALPALYDGRPALFRFPEFIDKTTPVEVGLGNVTLDLEASTIEVTGSAATLEQVNRYVDTLKFTTFTTDEEGAAPKPAFSAVVLTDFGRDETEASFTVEFSFDPILFDITRKINLIIPQDFVTKHSDVSSVNLFDGGGIKQTEGDSNAGQ